MSSINNVSTAIPTSTTTGAGPMPPMKGEVATEFSVTPPAKGAPDLAALMQQLKDVVEALQQAMKGVSEIGGTHGPGKKPGGCDDASHGAADIGKTDTTGKTDESGKTDGAGKTEEAGKTSGTATAAQKAELAEAKASLEAAKLDVTRATNRQETADKAVRAAEQVLENVKSAQGTHTVRAGDTMAKIAERYGINVEEVKNHNLDKLDKNGQIKTGSELKLPDNAGERARNRVEAAKAERQGATSALARADNAVKVATARIAQAEAVIKAAEGGGAAATDPKLETAQARLDAAAARLDVTMKVLNQRQGALSNAEQVLDNKQQLLQNVNEAKGKHTVGRGQTLDSIAGRYGLDVAALKQANRDKIGPNGGVKVGAELRIPDVARQAATKAVEAARTDRNQAIHAVDVATKDRNEATAAYRAAQEAEIAAGK